MPTRACVLLHTAQPWPMLFVLPCVRCVYPKNLPAYSCSRHSSSMKATIAARPFIVSASLEAQIGQRAGQQSAGRPRYPTNWSAKRRRVAISVAGAHLVKGPTPCAFEPAMAGNSDATAMSPATAAIGPAYAVAWSMMVPASRARVREPGRRVQGVPTEWRGGAPRRRCRLCAPEPASSAPAAATKPSMAMRPLTASGTTPVKAIASAESRQLLWGPATAAPRAAAGGPHRRS